MSKLKILAGLALGGVAAAALSLGAATLWARSAAAAVETRTYERHAGDFPIPVPLSQAEIEQLRTERAAALPPGEAGDPLAGVDLGALALQRAVERGRHLVEARYGCGECHGADFGGGAMIDEPMIGRVLGPNLTLGQGGVMASYTAADWDRKVRHGVSPDGRSGLMPSEDYQLMSDRELSDIVAYLRSLPPVDREIPPASFGPIGTMLVATGRIRFAAERLADYTAHPPEPPPDAPTVELGRHLLGTCTGCHRANFEGGPIVGGSPDWGPASNLSPSEDGLASWSFEDFDRVMRTGLRPDGTPVAEPMATMRKYGAAMTDTELQAMWAYLQTVAPVPDGL